MTTSATISGFLFKLGQANSPETFTTVEEVFSISGFGVLNNLVNVTNFDSPSGTMEYISGLSDGQEITVEANYVASATQQTALRTAVAGQQTRNFQIVNDTPSPDDTWAFAGVCLGWNIVPSPEDKNTIQYTIKITGAITES